MPRSTLSANEEPFHPNLILEVSQRPPLVIPTNGRDLQSSHDQGIYRLALPIGTTCTVASRISARNRLITDPRKRMSNRDRADCPNTTCEMLSCCANRIRASDTFFSVRLTTLAPSSRAIRWYSSSRWWASGSPCPLSSSGRVTYTAYHSV